MGLFDKLFGKKEKESLDQGLQKTKDGFLSRLTKAIAGKSTVDEEVLDTWKTPSSAPMWASIPPYRSSNRSSKGLRKISMSIPAI
jgi:hypothetical protein